MKIQILTTLYLVFLFSLPSYARDYIKWDELNSESYFELEYMKYDKQQSIIRREIRKGESLLKDTTSNKCVQREAIIEYNLSKLYRLQGRVSDRIKHTEKAWQKAATCFPNSKIYSILTLNQAICRFEFGNYIQARRFLESVNLDSCSTIERLEAEAFLSKCDYKLSDYIDAIKKVDHICSEYITVLKNSTPLEQELIYVKANSLKALGREYQYIEKSLHSDNDQITENTNAVLINRREDVDGKINNMAIKKPQLRHLVGEHSALVPHMFEYSHRKTPWRRIFSQVQNVQDTFSLMKVSEKSINCLLSIHNKYSFFDAETEKNNDTTIVTNIDDNSWVRDSGLEIGDRIIAINGIKSSQISISQTLINCKSETVNFKIFRPSSNKEYQIDISLPSRYDPVRYTDSISGPYIDSLYNRIVNGIPFPSIYKQDSTCEVYGKDNINTAISILNEKLNDFNTENYLIFTDWRRNATKDLRTKEKIIFNTKIFAGGIFNGGVNLNVSSEESIKNSYLHLINNDNFNSEPITWDQIKGSISDNQLSITFFRNEDYRWLDGRSEDTKLKAFIVRNNQDYPIVISFDSFKEPRGNIEIDKIAFYSPNKDNIYKWKHTASLHNSVFVESGGENNLDTVAPVWTYPYESLWGKLSQYINESDTVYITNTRYIDKLNIEILKDSNGILANDRYNIRRVSSPLDINDSGNGVIPDPSIAMWGNLNYSEEYKKLAYNRYGWSYLPGTLSEIDSIEKIFSNAERKALRYEEYHGTEESFRDAINSRNISLLHISTHGFTEDAFIRSIIPSYNRNYSYSSFDTLSLSVLERFGLIFSNCGRDWNKTNNRSSNDGILSLDEILDLNLSHIKLVVLSACLTGVGYNMGYNTMNIPYALKHAGVQKIIYTTEKIDDIHSAEFMDLFYKKLLQGMTVYDAFHDAQKRMMNKYPNIPLYWASFILLE